MHTTPWKPWPIAIGLALAMMATRGQHGATLTHLPDASWAVFFLAGVYLPGLWSLPAYLALAWGLDFLPELAGGATLTEIISGGQAYCLTPAYAFLLPAYGALWLAGRWFARRHPRLHLRHLPDFAGAALVGTVACELLSSGGFYFFSGRFPEPVLSEFGARLLTYLPGNLETMAFYLGIALLVHGLLARLPLRQRAHNLS